MEPHKAKQPAWQVEEQPAAAVPVVGQEIKESAVAEPAIGVEPQNKNEQLLLAAPGLHNFWDGGKWVVTQERLQAAANSAGIVLPAPIPPESADLFQVARSYTGDRLIECKGRGVSVVLQDVQWGGGELWEMLGDKVLEDLGCDVDELIADTVDVSEIRCDGGAYRVSVVRIDTPSELAIDRDIVGECLREQVTPSMRDPEATRSDKVAQRVIASSLRWTGVEQPRFLDAREINPPIRAVRFSDIDLSGFPVQEMESLDPTEKQILIFEDVYQGFAVVQDGHDRYVVSENPVVQLAARRNFLDKGALAGRPSALFAVLFGNFIEELRNQSFSVGLALLDEFADQQEDWLDDCRADARQLLAHPDSIYIKSARTAGGELVLRSSKDANGAPVIESDSWEVGDVLAHYTRLVDDATPSLAQQNATPERPFSRRGIEPVIKCGSVEGFLAMALRRMKTPIVEEQINATRVRMREGSLKAEFRMIFQGQEELKLVGHYAKASLSDVAANISLGGRGRSTEQVIRAIFQQELKGKVRQAEINQRAGTSFLKVQDVAQTFAREFAKELAKSQSQRRLVDFAIDLIPVWDVETQDLRVFLLEVQFGYRFKGLESISSEKARQVQSFRDELLGKRRRQEADLRLTSYA